MSDFLEAGILEDGRLLLHAGKGAAWVTPAAARAHAERILALAKESEELHPPVIVKETPDEAPTVLVGDGVTDDTAALQAIVDGSTATMP